MIFLCGRSIFFFGNQSKYERGNPESMMCHHSVHPKGHLFHCAVPDLTFLCSFPKTSKICTVTSMEKLPQRRSSHTVRGSSFKPSGTFFPMINLWMCTRMALSFAVLTASYKVYPRFFSYGADYPEKCVLHFLLNTASLTLVRVLLSGIKFLGTCACPDGDETGHEMSSP